MAPKSQPQGSVVETWTYAMEGVGAELLRFGLPAREAASGGILRVQTVFADYLLVSSLKILPWMVMAVGALSAQPTGATT